ncbi:MAG: hypothetical protein ACI9T7_002020, partial [Oleiphilaceae bacterium]
MLIFCSSALGESAYSWYVFNLPPFGSESKDGIGFELVKAYEAVGLKGKIII